MAYHTLGGYTFEWNPEKVTIPEPKKTVAQVKTHAGSDVFQWPAIIEGEEITMTWDLMSIAQYDAINTLYQSMDVVTWNPQYLGTYQVILSHFIGTYLEVSLDNIAYRENVILKLIIRSFTAS